MNTDPIHVRVKKNWVLWVAYAPGQPYATYSKAFTRERAIKRARSKAWSWA